MIVWLRTLVLFGVVAGAAPACTRAHASGPTTPVRIAVDVKTSCILSLGDSWEEGVGNHSNTAAPDFGFGQFSGLPALIWSRQAALAAEATGYHAAGARSTTYAAPAGVCYVNDGKSATGLQDIATNVQTRFCAHHPTVTLWHISPNDWAGWPGSTVANQFADAAEACAPSNITYIVSNELGNTEQWTALGWDQAVAANSSVTNINSTVKAWALTRNQAKWKWVNLRGDLPSDAFTILEYESLHNGPAPGASYKDILATNNHPRVSDGQTILAGILFNWFDVTY